MSIAELCVNGFDLNCVNKVLDCYNLVCDKVKNTSKELYTYTVAAKKQFNQHIVRGMLSVIEQEMSSVAATYNENIKIGSKVFTTNTVRYIEQERDEKIAALRRVHEDLVNKSFVDDIGVGEVCIRDSVDDSVAKTSEVKTTTESSVEQTTNEPVKENLSKESAEHDTKESNPIVFVVIEDDADEKPKTNDNEPFRKQSEHRVNHKRDNRGDNVRRCAERRDVERTDNVRRCTERRDVERTDNVRRNDRRDVERTTDSRTDNTRHNDRRNHLRHYFNPYFWHRRYGGYPFCFYEYDPIREQIEEEMRRREQLSNEQALKQKNSNDSTTHSSSTPHAVSVNYQKLTPITESVNNINVNTTSTGEYSNKSVNKTTSIPVVNTDTQTTQSMKEVSEMKPKVVVKPPTSKDETIQSLFKRMREEFDTKTNNGGECSIEYIDNVHPENSFFMTNQHK